MELLVGLGTVYGAERLVPIASAQVAGGLVQDDRRVGPRVALVPRRPSGRAGRAEPDRHGPRALAGDGGRPGLRDEAGAGGRGLPPPRDPARVHLHSLLPLDHELRRPPRLVRVLGRLLRELGDRRADEPRGGPTALAAALVGKTPYYGLHLVENRRPTVVVEVEGAPAAPDGGWYGALGVLAGREVGGAVPVLPGDPADPRRAQEPRCGHGRHGRGCALPRRPDHARGPGLPIRDRGTRDGHVRRGRGRGGLVRTSLSRRSRSAVPTAPRRS